MANERMVELWEREQRIKSERAEAAYFAVPEAAHKSLELTEKLVAENTQLRTELTELRRDFKLQTGPLAKWKERGAGFILGCAASMLVTLAWWQMVKQWPIFR